MEPYHPTIRSWPLNGFERWALTLCLFITALVTIQLCFLRCGLMHFAGPIAAVVGVIAATAGHMLLWPKQPFPASRKETRATALLMLCTLLYLGSIYFHSVTLPARDPVADATYAVVLERGHLLNQYYLAGDNGRSYPPGVPLLLSHAQAVGGIFANLYLFKWLCVLSVGVIPLAWAWATWRLFDVKGSFFLLALAYYVSAFCIERTLNYTLPGAGKNSQVILLALFPAFLVLIQRSIHSSWIYILPAVVSLAGLILIHYSAIHLAFATLLALLICKAAASRGNMKPLILWVIKPFLAGLCAVAAFLLLMPSVLSDTPSTLGGTYDFQQGLRVFFDTFLMIDSPLSIFNMAQPVGSPLRGYLLIACLLLAIYFGTRSDMQRDTAATLSSTCMAGACFFIALVISVVFGSGLINAGVSLDYVRWYSIPLEIAIIGGPAYCLMMCLRRSDTKVRVLGLAGLGLVPVVILISDTSLVAHLAKAGAFSAKDIRFLSATFTSHAEGCFIHAPNQVIDPRQGIYAQHYALLEYSEAATPCVLADGGWVHRPRSQQKPGTPPAIPSVRSAGAPPVEYFVGTAAEFAAFDSGNRWQRLVAFRKTDAFVWKKLP